MITALDENGKGGRRKNSLLAWPACPVLVAYMEPKIAIFDFLMVNSLVQPLSSALWICQLWDCLAATILAAAATRISWQCIQEAHGVATVGSSATKITDATIYYCCAASLY
jgi:hypothetical protein